MAGLARRLTALAASASTSIEHIGRLSIPCTSATTTPCSRNGNWAFAHPRFVGRFSSAVPEWPPAGVQPSPFMKVRLVRCDMCFFLGSIQRSWMLSTGSLGSSTVRRSRLLFSQIFLSYFFQVPPLSWKELEAHHPQNEGTPMAYGTDIERAQVHAATIAFPSSLFQLVSFDHRPRQRGKQRPVLQQEELLARSLLWEHVCQHG